MSVSTIIWAPVLTVDFEVQGLDFISRYLS